MAETHYQEALALFEATGSRQGQANCYLGLARLALDHENAQAAHEWAGQAIALHTANSSRYDVALDLETLAQAQVVMSHTDDAVASLRQAADLYATIDLPDRAASALNTLANALENAERAEEALTVYASVVALQPNEGMWRRNYANSLIKLGRLDEAAVQLDEAERFDSAAPYLALRRAELAKARTDHLTAAEWAQEALRRQPDWKEAQEILAWASGEMTS